MSEQNKNQPQNQQQGKQKQQGKPAKKGGTHKPTPPANPAMATALSNAGVRPTKRRNKAPEPVINKKLPPSPVIWEKDGIDHLNISNRSPNRLSSFLAFDFDYRFTHPLFGRFAALNGLVAFITAQVPDENFRTATGKRLRSLERANELKYGPPRRLRNIYAVIMQLAYDRLKAVPNQLENFKGCDLPFDSYMALEGSGVLSRNANAHWVTIGYEEIRKALREGREPDFSMLMTDKNFPPSEVLKKVIEDMSPKKSAVEKPADSKAEVKPAEPLSGIAPGLAVDTTGLMGARNHAGSGFDALGAENEVTLTDLNEVYAGLDSVSKDAGADLTDCALDERFAIPIDPKIGENGPQVLMETFLKKPEGESVPAAADPMHASDLAPEVLAIAPAVAAETPADDPAGETGDSVEASGLVAEAGPAESAEHEQVPPAVSADPANAAAEAEATAAEDGTMPS